MSDLDTLTDARTLDERLTDLEHDVAVIREHVEKVAALVDGLAPLVEQAQGNPMALLAGLMRGGR